MSSRLQNILNILRWYILEARKITYKYMQLKSLTTFAESHCLQWRHLNLISSVTFQKRSKLIPPEAVLRNKYLAGNQLWIDSFLYICSAEVCQIAKKKIGCLVKDASPGWHTISVPAAVSDGRRGCPPAHA